MDFGWTSDRRTFALQIPLPFAQRTIISGGTFALKCVATTILVCGAVWLVCCALVAWVVNVVLQAIGEAIAEGLREGLREAIRGR